ncbi:MAG: hypothetical protein L3J81_04000 [Thermoplasmata archaeon]|jgi:hypothetical protein|nr:hypothetical protein [Thermoplasmata archaeon]
MWPPSRSPLGPVVLAAAILAGSGAFVGATWSESNPGPCLCGLSPQLVCLEDEIYRAQVVTVAPRGGPVDWFGVNFSYFYLDCSHQGLEALAVNASRPGAATSSSLSSRTCREPPRGSRSSSPRTAGTGSNGRPVG